MPLCILVLYTFGLLQPYFRLSQCDSYLSYQIGLLEGLQGRTVFLQLDAALEQQPRLVYAAYSKHCGVQQTLVLINAADAHRSNSTDVRVLGLISATYSRTEICACYYHCVYQAQLQLLPSCTFFSLRCYRPASQRNKRLLPIVAALEQQQHLNEQRKISSRGV